MDDYFTDLYHTISTVSGLLTNITFSYEDKNFIQKCKEHFSVYSGPIINIDSNFMHLHNPEHPIIEKKVIRKKKKTAETRKRRMRGDGSCFESCISIRVLGYYKDEEGNIIENYYQVKLFQTGVISIPGARESNFSDIMEPIKEVANFMSKVFETSVEIKNLRSTMINYKYYLKSGGDRKRQIDILSAYIKFNNIKNSNPLVDMRDVMNYLIETDEYYKEELKYKIISAKSYIKTLRINIDELDKLIKKYEIIKKKKALDVLKIAVGEYYIIKPIVFDSILKRFMETFIVEIETELKNSVHNLIRQVTYNTDKDPSVMVEFRSPIPKKSGKGIKFKIFDSGKINVGGAVNEESTIRMTAFLNSILSDKNNNIIYHDDEESCTSEDSTSEENASEENASEEN